MHLVINATELGRQRGGNESYIAGLLEGLTALNPSVQTSLFTCDWDIPLNLPREFQQVNLGRYHRFSFFLWQQTMALRRLKPDWYLANFFLPPILPCRGAVVIHDLSFRAHPEYFPRSVSWYMHYLSGIAVRKASQILTVSEFSRRELIRFYDIDPRKIAAIPNGVSQEFRPLTNRSELAAEQAVLARNGIVKPYIFALGNIHPRKNLGRLLEAYLCLKSQRASVPAMVWGGLQRWDSDSLVKQANAAGVVLPGFIVQEDLPTLYRQAEMLVYPSLYEGFGLPPLEAMACGTPVVASNTTSLPEVIGNAGLTVDPTSIEAITKAMADLLDNTALRNRLQQAGIERAGEFTWKQTAKRLLEALEAQD